jgi:hypothetical protein
LGISREAIHYNSPSCFYPLAELPTSDDADYRHIFDTIHPSIYDRIKSGRASKLATSSKRKVPVYHVNQLVFAVDHSPASQGVSSILKLPTVGPFRISAVDARNVTLIDIESGKQYTSHVEYIRPINLSEFKLLLNKKWDLNAQFVKSAQPTKTRSQFNTAPAPVDRNSVSAFENTVPELEDEINLEDLFSPAPAPTGINTAPAPVQPLPIPNVLANPAPDSEQSVPFDELINSTVLAPEPHRVNPAPAPDEFIDKFAPELNFNSYQVSQDVSQQYKESLQLKNKKVSFVNKLKNFFS